MSEYIWPTIEATLQATYYPSLRELEVSSGDEVLLRVADIDEHECRRHLHEALGHIGDNLHLELDPL